MFEVLIGIVVVILLMVLSEFLGAIIFFGIIIFILKVIGEVAVKIFS